MDHDEWCRLNPRIPKKKLVDPAEWLRKHGRNDTIKYKCGRELSLFERCLERHEVIDHEPIDVTTEEGVKMWNDRIRDKMKCDPHY